MSVIEEWNPNDPASFGVTRPGPRHLHDRDDVWEGGREMAGKTRIIFEGSLRRARRLFEENGPAELGEPDADGFCAWSGGSIPVNPRSKVSVQFRGGYRNKDGSCVQASAFRFDWEHTGGNDDIVALKVIG